MNDKIILVFAFCFSVFVHGQGWSPEKNQNTYKNPIIYADYSDPDVIRVGQDFFMTSSSFNATPGLPILHSKDMIHWTVVNHALQKQIPDEVFQVPQHGKGVWAPSLRYHNDTYFIYWGDPDFGIYMTKTKDPFGKWDEPVLVHGGKGLIDPSPLFDEDGQAYLVHAWAASRAGVNSLLTVHRMAPDGTKVLDEGRHVYDGHGTNYTIEGSKFYKHNGYYYIFAPAGGVEFGWQLVLRSKSVFGPYEVKKVLEQGSTNVNGPHQGAWVTAPNGTNWFYHFQDRGAYGRIIHLQPMKWKNDWPVMGIDYDKNGVGEPVASYTKPVLNSRQKGVPQTTDNFDAEALGLQWQWNANPSIRWYAKLPSNNFLRLFPFKQVDDNLLYNPNILLQKFPAPDFVATTKITVNPERTEAMQAGLVVMGYDYAYVSLASEDGKYFVRNYTNLGAVKSAKDVLISSKEVNTNTVWLRVRVQAPEAKCTYSYSLDGEKFFTIGTPFTAVQGGWIGAKVGVFCEKEKDKKSGGFADFAFFKVD